MVLDSFSDKQRIELWPPDPFLEFTSALELQTTGRCQALNRPGRSTVRIVDLIRPKSVPDLNQKAIPIPKPMRRGIQRQQHLRSPHIRRGCRQNMPQSHGTSGHRIAHIQAHTTAQQPQFMPPVLQSRENSSQLAAFHKQIIRPFDPNGNPGTLQPLGQRKGDRQAEQAGARGIKTNRVHRQGRTQPHSAGRSLPLPAPLPHSPALVTSHNRTGTLQQWILMQPLFQ